ncbi:NanoRNase/pAp phosphatase [Caulifigura coniformis]|uniref:NanoRNase/pAp phosphatase n=1 Tax=Caulifigura coniformis TaxID=2527983 RepID=A0A517SA21_9PLAN|nr:bifunctional oligoribonuclease/PAP phosphatase NrnA [Caulifigura coniformis]QDT52977.1 NanoRNase/pAp phosphatase [Caulifigura coniformis]
MIDWRPLIAIVHDAHRFVITSHVRPDADAIGSEMGLAGALRALGKDVRIINPSATPNHLSFLDPHASIFKLGEGITVEEACQTDVHIIVDTSAWQQIDTVGKVIEKTAATKVVIDHHISSDNLGAVEFKDTSAAAAGVLVLEFIEALGLVPNIDQATQIFTAIATDTGWFRFPSVDVRTMDCVKRLVGFGVQPAVVYRELYERSTLSRLKLHGRVLSRVAVDFEGKLAHTFVLQKDFEELNAHPSDTEDLVNDCLTINGAQCAIILVEQKSGQVKCSFRSRTGLDVARVAETFGGGGHRQASGAMLPGPFATAQARVLKAIEEALTAE